MTKSISLDDFELDVDDTDGVMILVVPSSGPIKALVPQLGLMTEARLEMQIPHIYRAISIRRAQEAERQNERTARVGAQVNGGGKPRRGN